MLRYIFAVHRSTATVNLMTEANENFLERFTTFYYQQKFWKTTAAIATQPVQTNNDDQDDASFIAEWNAAKPFEEIPGRRSIPFLGTGWIMLPVVGKTAFPFH